MPFKLNKSKINLRTVKKNSKKSASVGKILGAMRSFEDTAPKTAEGEIAFNDEDTNARYIRLQKKGINLLRTEIIAITEFIPVAVGNDADQDTNKINYSLGNNRQVSVTNVARLIELHRQIREYVITAAEAVLQKIYPGLSAPGFLEDLKAAVNSNFDRCVAPTISETVENIMIAVEEAASGPSQKRIRKNKTSPFLIATIEYFVYENLVEEIVQYLGSVAQIDNKFKKSWSLEKFYKFKSFSPGTLISSELKDAYSNTSTFLDDRDRLLVSLVGMHKTSENSDSDVFANVQSHLASLILMKDSASVLITAEDSDVGTLEIEPGTVRYGLSGDLADAIDSLKDITLSGMLCGFGSGTGEDRAAVGADVSSGLVKVSNGKLNSIFTSIENAQGESVTDISEGINELMIAMSYDFITAVCGAQNVRGKLSNLGRSTSLGSADAGTGDNPGKLTLLTYLGNVLGCPKEQLNIDGGLEYVRTHLPNLGSAYTDFDGLKFEPEREGLGTFGARLLGVREFNNEDRDVYYSPLESTSKETTREGQGYIPATQFFVESAIERSGENIELKDLNEFIELYESIAKNMQSDILTLVPDSKVAENKVGSKRPLTFLGKHSARTHLEYLNKKIADDLDDIIKYATDPEKSLFPQLAVFVRDQSGGSKIRNFQATFWALVYRSGQAQRNDRVAAGAAGGGALGVLTAAAAGYSAFLLLGPVGLGVAIGASIIGGIVIGAMGAKRNPAEFFKLINCSNDKAEKKIIRNIGVFAHYYLETAIIDFLENTCNIDMRTKKKGKFLQSKNKYRTFVEGGNKLKEKDVRDAMPTQTPINSECKVPVGTTTKLATKHQDIDNLFEDCFAEGKSLNKLGDDNYNNSSSPKTNYGFFRLFRRSLPNVVYSRNLEIEATLGKDNLFDTFPFANTMFYNDEDDKNPRIIEEPGKSGGIVGFASHQRSLILLSYVHNLMRKCIQVRIMTNKKGTFEIKVDLDHVRGLRHALLGTKRSQVGSAESKLAAYDTAKVVIDDLFEKYDARESRIRDCSSLFALHAAGFKEAQRKAQEIINGKTKKARLSINTMKEMGIFKDALTLNNDDSPSLITHSFQKNYLTKPGSLFPRDIHFNSKKTQMMIKFLSEQGFGFLEEEKRGNKSLLHIGIPNSMLSALQMNAFEETDDIDYLTSPYVCLSVFKKSHLYPEYEFYPKNYIFDTSATILDYNPKNGELARHLKRYRGDATFNDLLKNVEISRFNVDENGKTQTVVTRGYGTQRTSGVYDKDVLINHVTDYMIKEYCKLTTGLDFDEDTFLLRDEPINFDIIASTNLLGEKLKNEYIGILKVLQNIYPESINDPQLKSEVFRMTKIIKQAAPFSFVNRFTKAVTPKSFDRVYSILVNEKDFILNSSENIFNKPVEFHINSRLQRPDKLNVRYQGKVNMRAFSSNVSQQDNEITKYAKSINENYPEVYNYSVSLSLLPLNFEDGAVVKPPYTLENSAQDITNVQMKVIDRSKMPSLFK